jgi:hypothetical protein
MRGKRRQEGKQRQEAKRSKIQDQTKDPSEQRENNEKVLDGAGQVACLEALRTLEKKLYGGTRAQAVGRSLSSVSKCM